ncbi:hypothetical protein V2J09_010674 [Rumex salicifolius]
MAWHTCLGWGATGVLGPKVARDDARRARMTPGTQVVGEGYWCVRSRWLAVGGGVVGLCAPAGDADGEDARVDMGDGESERKGDAAREGEGERDSKGDDAQLERDFKGNETPLGPADVRLQGGHTTSDLEKLKEFSEWILRVGDGTIEESKTANSIASIDEKYFVERPILASTLDIVEKDVEDLYSVEYLNSFKLSSIPNHRLKLKVVVPTMLLRNIRSIFWIVYAHKFTMPFFSHYYMSNFLLSLDIGSFLSRATPPFQNLPPTLNCSLKGGCGILLQALRSPLDPSPPRSPETADPPSELLYIGGAGFKLEALPVEGRGLIGGFDDRSASWIDLKRIYLTFVCHGRRSEGGTRSIFGKAEMRWCTAKSIQLWLKFLTYMYE